MSSGIQVYADKENSHQLGLLPGKGKQANATRPKLAGKTFQSALNKCTSSQTRKALGSLDGNIRAKLESKSVQKPQLEFKIPAKPASKPKSTQASKKEERAKCNQAVQEGAVKLLVNGKSIPWLDEEIERMPSLQEKVEDDYSDLWPLEERPSTYLQQMKAWRPACLLPARGTPSSQEDEESLAIMMEQLLCCTSQVTDDTLEEPELDLELIPEEEIPVIDIPFPPADSLSFDL